MSNNNTHYFVFRKNHKLYGCWIEIIGSYSENEAQQVFRSRYGYWNYPKDPSILKFHRLGCYEQIHLPLPEQVMGFNSEDPFTEPKPRDEYSWAMIGMNRTGKSSFNPTDWAQMMGRVNRYGQNNKIQPILILDDYRSLLPSKKQNIHDKINMNAARAVVKKYTKDFKLTYRNSGYDFPHIKVE